MQKITKIADRVEEGEILIEDLPVTDGDETPALDNNPSPSAYECLAGDLFLGLDADDGIMADPHGAQRHESGVWRQGCEVLLHNSVSLDVDDGDDEYEDMAAFVPHGREERCERQPVLCGSVTRPDGDPRYLLGQLRKRRAYLRRHIEKREKLIRHARECRTRMIEASLRRDQDNEKTELYNVEGEIRLLERLSIRPVKITVKEEPLPATCMTLTVPDKRDLH